MMEEEKLSTPSSTPLPMSCGSEESVCIFFSILLSSSFFGGDGVSRNSREERQKQLCDPLLSRTHAQGLDVGTVRAHYTRLSLGLYSEFDLTFSSRSPKDGGGSVGPVTGQGKSPQTSARDNVGTSMLARARTRRMIDVDILNEVGESQLREYFCVSCYYLGSKIAPPLLSLPTVSLL